jgi:hypothetical protein
MIESVPRYGDTPGLYRTATSVLMYKAARTWVRPPQVVRVPRRVPQGNLCGAACFSWQG